MISMNNIGMKNVAIKVAASMPPITPVPIEWREDAPAPVLMASGIPSLWLNLGHGSSGWALSCGSARVLADQIAGRAPEIDTEGLDVRRLAG